MTLPPVGLPRDPAQWIALALVIAVIAFTPRLLRRGCDRWFVAIAALSAAVLSLAYVFVYLRGGPRIIDASAYFLEARTISKGLLSFPLREPATSVLGRFLVRSEHADGPHAAVIFPPGWPAILALGFLARAPMLVGPLIAAAIVVVTYDLAEQLAKRLGMAESPSVARLAVLLSVLCAALRYHTADTMSHGLSALCFASSIALILRAIDAREAGLDRRALALSAGAGVAAGWLFATRPVSALALGITLAFILLRGAAKPWLRAALPIAIGAIPGAILFFAHQHAATGAWGMSSQRLYYELGDGPPGCFRYGFGAGIGCVGEHADFVRARLADGFGALAAAGTTLRRLKMHLVDPLNAEPLALLVPIGAFFAWKKDVRGRALAIAAIAQVLAYAPFYFDGNYPAGGGRFFCDVLPIEHALAAVGIVAIASKSRFPERVTTGALALVLAGFAFRAGFDHAQLRDRDGGRPLFDPADLTRAGITRGLVFVDTDHGFDLAYDPAPTTDLAFARFHGDGIDRLAWEARGRPPAYRHHFIPSPGGQGTVSIDPIAFGPAFPLIIEAESLWPPIAQDRGYALVEWASGSCASGSRWLAIHAAAHSERSAITLDLPATALAGRTISPRVALGGSVKGEVALVADGVPIRAWNIDRPGGAGLACLDLPPARAPERVKMLWMTLSRARESGQMSMALDAITAAEID